LLTLRLVTVELRRSYPSRLNPESHPERNR
jgi:hypothetical protein